MSNHTFLTNLYSEEIPSFFQEGMQIKEVQRLKGVDMNCGMQYTNFPFFNRLKPYSRYEHSVGVGLIVWHFTHDPKQALAGLFHDIATPAFSHVVDFANGDYEQQESTEDLTKEILKHSKQCKDLLDKLGISFEEVWDYHKYPIADNDMPQLSADRLEYMLGDLLDYEYADRHMIQHFYENLTVSHNEFGQDELCFKEEEVAFAFAEHCIKCSYIFTCATDRYGMEALASILRLAIEQKIITKQDLYKSEEDVIQQLSQSSLAKAWYDFRQLSSIEVSDKPMDDTWLQIASKKRYIDPYIEKKGRLSVLNKEAKSIFDTFLEQTFKEYIHAK